MIRRPPRTTRFPDATLFRAPDGVGHVRAVVGAVELPIGAVGEADAHHQLAVGAPRRRRSEEHTSELQSRQYLVCRLLLEKTHYILRTLFFSLLTPTCPFSSS